jgi:hypothetical protein
MALGWGEEQTMKKRFSEEQIIAVLKEQAANGKTLEVCRRHGISPAHAVTIARSYNHAGLYLRLD